MDIEQLARLSALDTPDVRERRTATGPAERLRLSELLLKELRHLLENGCTLSTALDVIDEIEAALRGDTSASPGQPHAQVDLRDALNRALHAATQVFNECRITVLLRAGRKRFVPATKPEIDALMAELIQNVIGRHKASGAARIVRFSIRNDGYENPSLIVEHSAPLPELDRPIQCGLRNVRIIEDATRNTTTLIFPKRA